MKTKQEIEECIEAFKVDNYSHCRVCDKWFGS